MQIPKTNNPIHDLTGLVFGKLSVIEYSGNYNGASMWTCLCECGNHKTVAAQKLKEHRTVSCGCERRRLHRDRMARAVTHGATKNGEKWREYDVWQAMKRRCNNPKDTNYHNYGGRGIRVCKRWMNSFSDYLSDLGGRFPDGMSVERIDPNGDYCPENCRLATVVEQARNKRKSIWLTIDGRRQHVIDWAKESGIGVRTIRWRLTRGDDPKAAVFAPLRTWAGAVRERIA